MDVTDRDDRDTGHGDDELAVLLDALDVALRARVDAARHAHAIARVVLGRVCPEVLGIAARLGGGNQDEGAHFLVPDGPGGLLLRGRVVHEVPVVVVLEVDQPPLLAADKHQRGDERLFLVGEPPLLVGLHGVDGDVALDPSRQQGLEVDDPVVEHLESVPVESVRGWLDQVWVGHVVRRTFLLLPGIQ